MDNLNLVDKNIDLNNNTNDLSLDEIISTETTDLQDDISQEDFADNSDTSFEENKAEECTALVEVKPHSLLVAQTMFKKSIRISIKSFLISLSLGFLNLFF